MSAHPTHGSWPHTELHWRSQRHSSHAPPPPIAAHPTHGSWPHKKPHRRSSSTVYMRPRN
eukprot:9476027-Pyramimonas_sp.AAC.1